MVGAGPALYEGGGTLEVWAAEEDGEENDEHPARAGNRVKDVTTSASRVLLPREAPRPPVTRMRNPCIPMQEV
jgi:hypothetical protein